MVKVPKVVVLGACVLVTLYAGIEVRDALREGNRVAAMLNGFVAGIWAAQFVIYWRRSAHD